MDKEEARPRAGVKSATAFRTISEVSDELEVPQHVLRFWETKFPQVRPLKRGGGRRYYRPEDVALLRNIRRLLYAEGYTIKGVQRLLKESRSAGAVGDAEAGVEDLLDSDVEDTESSPGDEVSAEDGVARPAVPEPGPLPTVPPPVSTVSAALPPHPGAGSVAAALPASPTSPPTLSTSPPARAETTGTGSGQPPVAMLPVWHRRQLMALRAELIELQLLLRKTNR